MAFLRVLTSAFLLVLCAACAPAQNGTTFPHLEGENLNGQKVVLPKAASGKIAVLIFGFTKASKTPSSVWENKLTRDFGSNKDLDVYQLAVLEDVPRLIRGMVISGIRKGIAEEKRDHFVPILQGETGLKQLVKYGSPDDAYLVVLDRSGRIRGQQHGSLIDADYAQLHSELEPLLKTEPAH